MENECNPPPLPNDPTIDQIRNRNDEVEKESKALVIIHVQHYMIMYLSRS